MRSILWDFEIQMDHQIPSRKRDQVLINKKKRSCPLENFAVVPADHKGKIKESGKIDKYLDLARELKNLWNMKVTVIQITIRTLGTVSKGLEKRLGKLESKGKIETIQTTILLKSARLLMRVLEI